MSKKHETITRIIKIKIENYKVGTCEFKIISDFIERLIFDEELRKIINGN